MGRGYRSKMRGNQRISLKLDEDQNNPDKTLIINADNTKEFLNHEKIFEGQLIRSNIKPLNPPKYISRIYPKSIAKAMAEMGRI